MKVNKSPFSIGLRLNPYILEQLRKDFNAGITKTAEKARRVAGTTAPQFRTPHRRKAHAHRN